MAQRAAERLGSSVQSAAVGTSPSGQLQCSEREKSASPPPLPPPVPTAPENASKAGKTNIASVPTPFGVASVPSPGKSLQRCTTQTSLPTCDAPVRTKSARTQQSPEPEQAKSNRSPISPMSNSPQRQPASACHQPWASSDTSPQPPSHPQQQNAPQVPSNKYQYRRYQDEHPTLLELSSELLSPWDQRRRPISQYAAVNEGRHAASPPMRSKSCSLRSVSESLHVDMDSPDRESGNGVAQNVACAVHSSKRQAWGGYPAPAEMHSAPASPATAMGDGVLVQLRICGCGRGLTLTCPERQCPGSPLQPTTHGGMDSPEREARLRHCNSSPGLLRSGSGSDVAAKSSGDVQSNLDSLRMRYSKNYLAIRSKRLLDRRPMDKERGDKLQRFDFGYHVGRPSQLCKRRLQDRLRLLRPLSPW